MPRRRCCGQIEDYPVCRRFVPDPVSNQPDITLGYEEIEAIRLKDMVGLEQEECARQMALTRPTFQRILVNARRKLATAVIEGQIIAIEGGHFQMANRVFECVSCGQIWEEPPCTEGGKHGYEIACPKCGSMKKFKLTNGVRQACGGAGHAHGHDGSGGCCGGHHA